MKLIYFLLFFLTLSITGFSKVQGSSFFAGEFNGQIFIPSNMDMQEVQVEVEMDCQYYSSIGGRSKDCGDLAFLLKPDDEGKFTVPAFKEITLRFGYVYTYTYKVIYKNSVINKRNPLCYETDRRGPLRFGSYCNFLGLQKEMSSLNLVYNPGFTTSFEFLNGMSFKQYFQQYSHSSEIEASLRITGVDSCDIFPESCLLTNPKYIESEEAFDVEAMFLIIPGKPRAHWQVRTQLSIVYDQVTWVNFEKPLPRELFNNYIELNSSLFDFKGQWELRYFRKGNLSRERHFANVNCVNNLVSGYMYASNDRRQRKTNLYGTCNAQEITLKFSLDGQEVEVDFFLRVNSGSKIYSFGNPMNADLFHDISIGKSVLD